MLWIRKQHATMGFTLLLLILLVWITFKSINKPRRVLFTAINANTNQHTYSSDPSTIHLVHMVKGEDALARATTMLKSIFYFQGRLKSNTMGCFLSRTTWNKTCDKERVPKRIPIHLHLVVEHSLLDKTQSVFRQWNATQITWTVYDLESFTSIANYFPNGHHSGFAALSKMFLPEILPTNVEKAILLDTDMLFNADVSYLWDHFKNFNNEQIIGMAWEPDNTLPNCSGTIIPSRGVNSGVILMHLQRMRAAKWSLIFERVARELVHMDGMLRTGEQTPLNLLILRRPELYYHLSCEWNVGIYFEDVYTCCPVSWTDRLDDEAICPEHDSPRPGDIKHPGRPNLIHLNVRSKPEGNGNQLAYTSSPEVMSTAQTREQLGARFIEVYNAFKAISQACFD